MVKKSILLVLLILITFIVSCSNNTFEPEQGENGYTDENGSDNGYLEDGYTGGEDIYIPQDDAAAAAFLVEAQQHLNSGGSPHDLYISKDGEEHLWFTYACAAGYTETVALFLGAGADVNSQCLEYGYTAIMWASNYEGHPEVVKLLIERGANVNISSDYGYNSLLITINTEIARMLINAGINIDFIVSDGANMTALIQHSMVENPEIVEMLVNAGADTTIRGYRNYTALTVAVDRGYEDIVRILLRSSNIDVDEVDLIPEVNVNSSCKEGTALHRAAERVYQNGFNDEASWQRYLEIFKMLFAAGANIHYKDNTGATPLFRLAFDHIDPCVNEMQDMLLAAGADMNTQDNDGNTVLYHTIEHQYAGPIYNYDTIEKFIAAGINLDNQNNIGVTVLMAAAITDHKKTVVKTFIDAGASVYIKSSNGSTALHNAAGGLALDNINLLLDAGADINAQGYSDRTALNTVALKTIHSPELYYETYAEVTQTLIDRGADVNIADYYGKTPLMNVTYSWYDENWVIKERVKMFLKVEGIKVDAVTKVSWEDNYGVISTGTSAFMLACRFWRIEVAQLLLDAGANINLVADNGLTILAYTKANNYKDDGKYYQDVIDFLEAAGAE